MRVPRLLVLTDRHQASGAGRTLVATAAAAVAGGAPAVVLRDKDLPVPVRRQVAHRLRLVCRDGGAALLVAGDPCVAEDVDADGVHLAAAQPPPRMPPGRLLGRSCHDAREVCAASADGVDYVTVSPVATSPSKPGYGPALGPRGLAGLVAAAGVPVLALGGVTPVNVPCWLRAGAHGVAVMGAVMAATDPAAVVRELLARLQEDHG